MSVARKKRVLPPTVVELDGDFEHRMLHTRGIRLHAVTAGDPSDPLIIFLHGALGGWFDFKDVIAPLAQCGFHVAALDLRGYGMSDKPLRGPGDEMLIAVGDVKGAIATLGHKSAIVGGADTGGSVAWVMAATYPAMVRGLISISAAHPTDLRMSMTARPWDFIPMIGRIFLTRLPPSVLKRWPRTRLRLYRDNLKINTTAPFHRSERFAHVLTIRQQAAFIDNAFTHTVRNSRLLVPKLAALPTASTKNGPVLAPTLLLHPQQSLWDRLVARQVKRSVGHVVRASVAHAKNLPHIENPAGFTAVVAEFACHIGPYPTTQD